MPVKEKSEVAQENTKLADLNSAVAPEKPAEKVKEEVKEEVKQELRGLDTMQTTLLSGLTSLMYSNAHFAPRQIDTYSLQKLTGEVTVQSVKNMIVDYGMESKMTDKSAITYLKSYTPIYKDLQDRTITVYTGQMGIALFCTPPENFNMNYEVLQDINKYFAVKNFKFGDNTVGLSGVKQITEYDNHSPVYLVSISYEGSQMVFKQNNAV